MTNLVKQQNEFCGVDTWHESNFTGKNVVIINCEGNGTHGLQTQQCILNSAPDTIAINQGIGTIAKNGEVYDYFVFYENQKHTLEEFIIKSHAKILTQSNHGTNLIGTWYSQELNRLKKKYNLIFLNLAGNVGDTCNGAFPSDVAIWVGASSLVKGKPKYVTNFCNGEDKDFTDFMGDFWGTSYSTPYLAGKIACIIQRYGDLSQDEVYEYLKMISINYESDKKNIYVGYGLPILPSIDKKYITMTTTSNDYYVNGNKCMSDTKPTNIDGTVFVPLRLIANELGAEIKPTTFNNDKSVHIEIVKGNTTIVLNTDSKVAYVNGNKVELLQAPYIDKTSNRTLVPLRFISEQFGCSVSWLQSEQKVLILEK